MIYPYVIQLDGYLRENNHIAFESLTSIDDEISSIVHRL